MKGISKAEEILRLAMILEDSSVGLTIDEMAEKLERPRRSVERLKAFLSNEMGFSLEEIETQSRKKRWRLKKGTIHSFIRIEDSEYALLEKIKQESLDETNKKRLKQIIEKIHSLDKHSTPAQKTNIADILENQKDTVKQYLSENIDIKLVMDVELSIVTQKKIQVKYKNSDELILHPYGIISWNHIPFLVAAAEGNEKIKIYRYSNLGESSVLEDYFEKPDDFNLQTFTNQSFGIYHDEDVMNVELLFDKNVRDAVKIFNFHPTQKIIEQKDGSVKVTFTACGKTELCWHLFTWEDSVKILKPQRLKDTYNKMLKRCLEANS